MDGIDQETKKSPERVTFLFNYFAPKANTVFCGKTRRAIEFPSPTKRIHVTFFDPFIFALKDNSVHHRFTDASALIFLSGANRLYQRCTRLLVNIDKAVSAHIVLFLRVSINHDAFKTVLIHR